MLAAGLALGAELAFAGAAQACVCVEAPMEERLDDADAAVVGRIVAEEAREADGASQRVLTIEVDQRVKGDVQGTLTVGSPSGTDCDIVFPRDEPAGFLLTREPGGGWFATACSVVDPGELVVAGGEPRGGPIKVGVGLVILALVLFWAFARLRSGARPELPGPS